MIIAILGYILGFLLAMIQYYFTQKSTLLPIEMTISRAIFVFSLTLMMSLLAGIIAINKLEDADPADIF